MNLWRGEIGQIPDKVEEAKLIIKDIDKVDPRAQDIIDNVMRNFGLSKRDVM